ncbi:hypothetical protein mRhiFer1_009834 [Rhinolophus ferrumequinum]|uniref:Reverse transcriptase RNase H-like domain-containing protein n=1 Tax=Rhinolophus ferrumequinum TaxID=59479 RepID=A0A7J7YS99_RHIFE|nr:hypothetical protein mRhiFer1_009834 [Rhinolophus ferrumequinum]
MGTIILHLYITERKGMAFGVLTQPRGPSQQQVGYLSKELDLVAHGWSACLQAIAVATLLVPEATKLTMGQDLTVFASHHFQGLLNADNSHWLTDSRLLQYEALLLKGPVIQIRTCSTINPATFLPETEEELTHNYHQVLMQTYAARADLQEILLDKPDWTLFTDGRSFIQNGICGNLRFRFY